MCYNICVIVMRQRNVKNKKEIISNSKYIILEPSLNKGHWQDAFKNNNPIYIEIGMGKGDFILENAKKYPNINFIGIEKYDSIIALAIKKIENHELDNLKLIRMDAKDIKEIFANEINKIYLNFSDPWPKPRHEKRRLTSYNFLSMYDQIFKKEKVIEMKTDNQALFEYSLMSFNNNGYLIKKISLDLHHSDITDNIMTEYERKFSAKDSIIYYVKAVK